MPSHRKTHRKPVTAAAKPVVAAKPADPFRRWLLAIMAALLVARPLFPSESAASEGDGLPLVMLWLALAVIWTLTVIGRPRFTLRFGPVDAAVLALVAWQCVASLYAVRYGSPRPALNMLWEWVGLGTVFLLARQLIRDAREARAIVAAMIALTAAVSVYGIYQWAVERPAQEKQYKADKEGMLREAGLDYPPGSPVRERFEKRLENHEPTATFALTNSLAAVLSPWLVVGLGALVASWHERRRWIAWLICLAPIAVCMLLTKSRSGYAAVGVGLVWFGVRWLATAFQNAKEVCRLGVDRMEKWWQATALQEVARAVLVVVGLLAIVGAIVGFVKPHAATSLGYRTEYWQATLRMIADRPWLGCGPGNFQNVYTRYKLPEASEEVADPHNFLLEVWATAGTPAMLALLGVLGLFAVRRRMGSGPSFNPEPTAAAHSVAAGSGLSRGRLEPTLPPGDDWKFVLAGLIGGFLLSIPLGQICFAPPAGIVTPIGLRVPVAVLIGLPVAVVCFAGLVPWVRNGNFSPALAGLGVVVLLVNLLSSGGIGIPAVAQSLWLLLALGLSACPGTTCGAGVSPALPAGAPALAVGTAAPQKRGVVLVQVLNGAWRREMPRAVAIGLLTVGLGLAFACHQTSYTRVLRCQTHLRLADWENWHGDSQSALEHGQEAADADPCSSDAHAFLAEIYLKSWLVKLDPGAYQAFETEDAIARSLAPEAASVWRDSARRHQLAFGKTYASGRRVQPGAIEQAIKSARRAVELYPNSGEYRADLAMLDQLSGDEAAYRREAHAALELDRRMPHEDKKLSAAVRRKLEAAEK